MAPACRTSKFKGKWAARAAHRADGDAPSGGAPLLLGPGPPHMPAQPRDPLSNTRPRLCAHRHSGVADGPSTRPPGSR
eukprot:8344925-Pyramimonas_sp.AAC.1